MWLTMKGRTDMSRGRDGAGEREKSGRREERETEEGGVDKKRVRPCEVTQLPLVVRCLPRTEAAARSDCTPLKQRALVI